MKKADLLAASGAVLLVVLQIGAGGVRPWAGREEAERIGARAGEIAALEEERAREKETLRLLEGALGGAGDARPSGAEPPPMWRGRLDSFPGGYAWGSAGTDEFRLEVAGRFEEVLDLLGLVDSDPGPFVVRGLDLVPDRGRVRMTVRLAVAGGGGLK